MSIAPLPTLFDGIQFRSRLEARWAAFWKACGLRYEYEFEGYNAGGRWVLPDFWLPDLDIFVEVKGPTPTTTDLIKYEMLAAHSGRGVVVAIGTPSPDNAMRLFLPTPENLHTCKTLDHNPRFDGITAGSLLASSGAARSERFGVWRDAA